MNPKKKIVYLTIMTFLTSTAVSATYWQYSRYQNAKKRWNIIGQELRNNNPKNLMQLATQQLFSFRYVKLNGNLIKNQSNKNTTDQLMHKVRRMKDGRLGYYVFRPIQVSQLQNNKIWLVGMEGWVPQNYQLPKTQTNKKKATIQYKQLIGLLRQGQTASSYDAKINDQNSYIDLGEITEQFEKKLPKSVYDKKLRQKYQKYYIQLLKPMDSKQQEIYPYKFSIDNFQLPYLTPDKHRGYALFWATTSCVGLWGILKVLF